MGWCRMLKITIDSERGVKKSLFASRWIKNAVLAALAEEKVSKNAEVNVLLTDDEGIRTINLEYRDKDAPTDVLSFPANALNAPLKQLLDQDFEPERDVRGGRLILGDIAISMERAQAQAQEYGHSLRREVSFLTAHAMLHLLGYDHMEQGEEEIMRNKQRLIMNHLKIKR